MRQAIRSAEAFVREAEASQVVREQLAYNHVWAQHGGLSYLLISSLKQVLNWRRMENGIANNVSVLGYVQGDDFSGDKLRFAQAIAAIPEQGR
jgi:hypothetical protein